MWEVILAGAAAVNLPALVEAAAKSTGERLFGPMLDYVAQPIKDRIAQRAKVAQILGDLAAKEIEENPEYCRSTVYSILARSGVRIDRVESTFIKAVEILAEDNFDTATPPSPPTDDWLNKWSRYAEDASSEQLQHAFAQIMAGEIKRKGSFSLPTLRVVAEMSAEIANDFQEFWLETIDDYAVKYHKYNRGEHWQKLLRLREAGLVAASDAAIHSPPNHPLWQFGTMPRLLVSINTDVTSEVPIINLTQVGLEIGKILPAPDIKRNLLKLANECPNKRGWIEANFFEITANGTVHESIWKSSA